MGHRDSGMVGCERVQGARFRMGGPLGTLLTGVVDNWLLTAPAANPGMLEMLRDRDRRPPRNMVPWSGEFAGKYLTAAVQVLCLTGDRRLRAVLEVFVTELVFLQDASGYMGPWPGTHALSNAAPNTGDPALPGIRPTWDTWGHYHMMLGLLLWHQETGDRKAIRAARGIGDLLCQRYLGKSPRLVDTRSTEMNLAPVHSLAMLHRRTGQARYLELAKEIVAQFAATATAGSINERDEPVPPGAPLAGNYLAGALAGAEFHELPKPRWESLHPIMGLAELHRITGRGEYRRAFEHLWWSIRNGDRHNNGGFSSGEKATGNPYDRGAIESCCTVAWIALCVEMLKLTANPVVADELELATLNSGMGMHSPTGRWATYNTPMDGVRRASAHDIVFQSREGTPELNCCSVNAPRGLGMISDWAIVAGPEGDLALNWYGASSIEMPLLSNPGKTVTMKQDTTYPRNGLILLTVSPRAKTSIALKLRIPQWSARTTVRVNGAPVPGIEPGTYLRLDRDWRRGDTVEIRLDMSLHLWQGRRECNGLASIYRGPVLLTWDRRFNDMDPEDVPGINLSRHLAPKQWRGPRPPALLFDATDTDGRRVRLVDFASAGNGGTPYRSWLPVSAGVGIRASPFVPKPGETP